MDTLRGTFDHGAHADIRKIILCGIKLQMNLQKILQLFFQI